MKVQKILQNLPKSVITTAVIAQALILLFVAVTIPFLASGPGVVASQESNSSGIIVFAATAFTFISFSAFVWLVALLFTNDPNKSLGLGKLRILLLVAFLSLPVFAILGAKYESHLKTKAAHSP